MAERGRVLIVRWSAAHALKECSSGGSVIQMEKGHAEVVDRRGYVRGFLTKRDYDKFTRLVRAASTRVKGGNG